MATLDGLPSLPFASSTNVRVGFFIDQYNIIYSKCKDIYIGVKDPAESLASSSNQVLFIALEQIWANRAPISLAPVSPSIVPEHDRDAHYDYWGVIPININPMTKKKGGTIDGAGDELKIQNTVTHQVAYASYFINAVDRRNKNLHKKPVELIRKLPKPQAATIAPSTPTPTAIPQKVEKKEVIIITQRKRNMSDTLDKFIDSAVEATTALAQLVADAKALAKNPPVIKEEVASKPLSPVCISADPPYLPTPDDIKDTYLVATAQRVSLSEGLSLVAKVLRGYSTQVPPESLINPNSSYQPGLISVADATDILANALLATPTEATPKNYITSLGGFLRNYSLAVSFMLNQTRFYPCFKPDTKIEKELSANVNKILKNIQEDLKIFRNNTNLLDV